MASFGEKPLDLELKNKIDLALLEHQVAEIRHDKKILNKIKQLISNAFEGQSETDELNAYLASNPINASILIALLRELVADVDWIRKVESGIKFAPVRKKGVAANIAKAETNKAFILKTNSDLLVHVDWARKTLDERAEYIAKQCETQKIKMANGKNYSESYIKKLITGV